MIIDVTRLAGVVRRFDVSATVQSFGAVLAPLYVLERLITTRFALTGPSEEVFSDSDVSSTISAIVLTALALAPLGFILSDWLARRQSLRHLSALTGALIGAVGFAAVGAIIAFGPWNEGEDASSPERELMVAAGTIAVISVLAWLLGHSLWLGRALRMLGIAVLAVVLTAFIPSQIDDLQFVQEMSPFAAIITVIAECTFVAFVVWWTVRSVQLRIVLSSDAPRTLLLGDLHRAGLWVRCAFLIGLPSVLWKAAAIRTRAFWMFVISRPLVYVGLSLLIDAETHFPLPVTLAMALGLLIGGHLAFATGKRLAALSIWRPDEDSIEGAPILFLRSFEDDQFDFRRAWWDVPGRWVDLWSFRRNADEALIDETAQYGPVVAFGRPGETQAPFGAMRHYAAPDNWQSIVTDAARRAQAIVMVAGETSGVLWEYDLLRREQLVSKTVVLFPPSPDAGQNALLRFEQTIGISEPMNVPGGREAVAFLHMNGRPTLLAAQRQSGAACIVALRAHFQRCAPEELNDPSYALDGVSSLATTPA